MGFIKNYASLNIDPKRKIVLDLIESALSSIQPKEILREKFSLSDNILSIQNNTYDLHQYKRIQLIGFGKGSAEISRIIEDILGDKLSQGFVIDVVDEKPFKKIHYTKGTHPLPSQENIDFTTLVLNATENLLETDLVLIVICGGGSVLFEKPHTVNLEKLTDIVRALLRSGATISEMNIIRKHLSSVKGGQFAKHLFPSTVASLIFSDVPGNDLSVIASAPTVKDQTTLKEVKQILSKFNISNSTQIDDSYFAQTVNDDKYFEKVNNILMVSNDTALKAMQNKATEMGLSSSIYSDKFEGDAKTAGKTLIDATKKGELLLAGGETTVHVKGSGQGGRNQTLVLATLPYLDNNTIIASFDSDGWDFTTLAGALGDQHVIQSAQEQSIEPKAYLENDDSLHFFQKASGGIDTGRLESNVSDLFIVYKQ